MLLREIKQYLSSHNQSTVDDLVTALKVDRDVLDQAIEHWIRKGKVEKIVSESLCDDCSCGCGTDEYGKAVLVLYKWIG